MTNLYKIEPLHISTIVPACNIINTVYGDDTITPNILHDHYEEATHQYWVAVPTYNPNNQVVAVGGACYDPERPEIGEYHHLATLPKARNHHLATYITQCREHWLFHQQPHTINTIQTSTPQPSPPTRNLFTKLGYSPHPQPEGTIYRKQRTQ